MACYFTQNKVSKNKLFRQPITIDTSVISNHINNSITSRLTGKNSSTDRVVYSSRNPYGGVGDAGIWVRNPNCWINGVTNISCFSPAQRSGANWWQRGGTLITRKHALFAQHFTTSILPNGGTPLIFVDENNNAIRRNIIQYGYGPAGSDIAIALLDSEVPSNIKIAKVLPTNFTNYIGSNTFYDVNPDLYCIGLDQEQKAILKLWAGGGTMSNVASNSTYSSWSENIVTGDSGQPIFLIIDNELVLLSTWYTGMGGNFISGNYNDVNSIIENLSPGQGYSLTPVNLDYVYRKYQPSIPKINKSIITNHINSSTSMKLAGKNASTDMKLYSSENPYGTFTRNPSCWLNGVDNISCFSPAQLSGAAWNQRGCTLITTKHVWFAKHYTPAIISGGTPIVFVDSNNNVVKRNLIQTAIYMGYADICVGLLDSDVPSNIKIAKVLPTNYANYLSNTIDSNQNNLFKPYLYAVGTNQDHEATLKICSYISSMIDPTLNDTFLSAVAWSDPSAFNASDYANMVPNPNNFTGFYKNIRVGDSGQPYFLIIDNTLVLLGAWWTMIYGPLPTGKYDAVNSLIESLSPGQGYGLTPIDLDAVYRKYDY